MQDFIKQFYDMCEELEKNQEILSEQIKTAKDQYNDNEIEIEREGKQIMVKEKEMWTEIEHLGTDSDAGKIMAKKYPEIFKTQEKVIALAQKTDIFAGHFFGLQAGKINIRSIVKIIHMFTEYQLRQSFPKYFDQLTHKELKRFKKLIKTKNENE